MSLLNDNYFLHHIIYHRTQFQCEKTKIPLNIREYKNIFGILFSGIYFWIFFFWNKFLYYEFFIQNEILIFFWKCTIFSFRFSFLKWRIFSKIYNYLGTDSKKLDVGKNCPFNKEKKLKDGPTSETIYQKWVSTNSSCTHVLENIKITLFY